MSMAYKGIKSILEIVAETKDVPLVTSFSRYATRDEILAIWTVSFRNTISYLGSRGEMIYLLDEASLILLNEQLITRYSSNEPVAVVDKAGLKIMVKLPQLDVLGQEM